MSWRRFSSSSRKGALGAEIAVDSTPARDGPFAISTHPSPDSISSSLLSIYAIAAWLAFLKHYKRIIQALFKSGLDVESLGLLRSSTKRGHP
ncbi:MAG: hypothetical protein Q9167_003228 [Letrouitia subvulpina]